eukprot:1156085-Pelagomonas_calceolata.AAC.1
MHRQAGSLEKAVEAFEAASAANVSLGSLWQAAKVFFKRNGYSSVFHQPPGFHSSFVAMIFFQYHHQGLQITKKHPIWWCRWSN